MTNTVSFDKMQATPIRTARMGVSLIANRAEANLIETIFAEKTSHLGKNTQLAINPTAQKIRHRVSSTAIVISPKLRL